MKNLISKTIALAVAVFIGASLTFANINSTKESIFSVNAAQIGTLPQTNHQKHHRKKATSAKVQNQMEMKNMPMKTKKQNPPLKKKRMGMKKKTLKKKSNMKNMKMNKDKMKMKDMDM